MPSTTLLLSGSELRRPPNMLNDDCLSGLTWADLQDALGEIASPANKLLVEDVVTALWENGNRLKSAAPFLPESHFLVDVLVASVLLASPECFTGSVDAPSSPS